MIYNGRYIISRGDNVVVGDLMKSISLLMYKASTEGSAPVLEEIARDHRSNWMTAVEALDYETFLGAENGFNLFTLRKVNVAKMIPGNV